jgi:hypothetical protein
VGTSCILSVSLLCTKAPYTHCCYWCSYFQWLAKRWILIQNNLSSDLLQGVSLFKTTSVLLRVQVQGYSNKNASPHTKCLLCPFWTPFLCLWQYKCMGTTSIMKSKTPLTRCLIHASSYQPQTQSQTTKNEGQLHFFTPALGTRDEEW